MYHRRRGRRGGGDEEVALMNDEWSAAPDECGLFTAGVPTLFTSAACGCERFSK